MSKDDSKYSKFAVVAYVVFALIFLGSLLSKFNVNTFLYLVAVTVFVIRYFIAVNIKK